MENTKESFDNYYNDVNINLHKCYPEKFVNYLLREFGDKWEFHLKFESEKYYPFTLLGNVETIKNLGNLPNNVYYYIKKRNGSYGRQIQITKNPSEFFRKNLERNMYVIQREIDSMIYNNRKFDYRVYLIIYKREGEIRYGYYNRYVIRNCVNEYSNNSDIYCKLTNHHIYSLRGLDENFYILDSDFGLDHKSKINRLSKRVLRKIKEYEDNFYDLLDDNNFRILGVDYIVERNTSKLFLLEINITSGVYYENVLDEFYKKYNNFHLKMVMDLNELIFNDNIVNFVIL